MKYTILFATVAIALAGTAILHWDNLGWVMLLFIYAGISHGLIAVAYFGAGPKMLMKRPTGQHSVVAWLLFAPYFLETIVSFWFYRHLTRKPAYAQVLPNLYFGRRLVGKELQDVPWVSVLDLAPEFAESRPFTQLPGYRSFPILDATAPTTEQLNSAVTWLTAAVTRGPVYVHCALGHGRTASIVVAYLLATGIVPTAEEGMKKLRELRPGTEVNRAQWQRLLGFKPI